MYLEIAERYDVSEHRFARLQNQPTQILIRRGRKYLQLTGIKVFFLIFEIHYVRRSLHLRLLMKVRNGVSHTHFALLWSSNTPYWHVLCPSTSSGTLACISKSLSFLCEISLSKNRWSVCVQQIYWLYWRVSCLQVIVCCSQILKCCVQVPVVRNKSRG